MALYKLNNVKKLRKKMNNFTKKLNKYNKMSNIFDKIIQKYN